MKGKGYLDDVMRAAYNNGYRNRTKLIKSVMSAGVITRIQAGENLGSYSYSSIYAMLRDGNSPVADKIIKYADENPIV